MQTGVFDKVLASHLIDGIYVANMLDNGCYGYGNHEDDGLPRELGTHEGGQGKPRRIGYRLKVDKSHNSGSNIAHHDTREDRYEAQQPLAEEGDDDRGEQSDDGQQPVLLGHIDARARE